MSRNRRGFTLIESLFSLLITLFVSIGTIAAIIYTRQSMELDKQRVAALNYCRRAMEAAETNSSIDAGTQTLVPFNDPGTHIDAEVSAEFYAINSDGTINWSTSLSAPPQAQPALCRIKVKWTPSGSWSREQTVQMSTIVRAGTT